MANHCEGGNPYQRLGFEARQNRVRHLEQSKDGKNKIFVNSFKREEYRRNS